MTITQATAAATQMLADAEAGQPYVWHNVAEVSAAHHALAGSKRPAAQELAARLLAAFEGYWAARNQAVQA